MSKPTIYVFAPDLSHPLGGMRMLYRHVDVLNANGFQAYIVHCSPKFEIDWFEYSTPVLRGRIEMKPQDIAVCSEIGGLNIAEWAEGKRTVIFNQNCYYTFARYPMGGGVNTPYLQPQIMATIVASEDSRRYMQWVFPKLAVYRIRYGIDPELYYPQQKKKQICFMPRKNKEDAKQVLYTLRYRNKLDDWTVRLIDGVSEARAAEIIRESAIFMSFGHPEGFGLPPAEAMAAECIVVGYHGNGGREFFSRAHGLPVEMGDVLGYAQTMEQILQEYEHDPSRLKDMTREAGRFIRDAYSLEAERESIVECWEAIIGR